MRNFGFGLGFGTGTAGVENEWYDAAAYADMAAVADFNSDRYAITTVALGSVPAATAAQLKVKRAATFAEVFAFTAASTTERTYTDGSGVIKSDLAANAPRFTYVNAKRQLRLENAATNLLTYSAPHTAGWTATASGALTNAAATGPDGTVTAGRLTASASNLSGVRANVTYSATTAYTFSCYVKLGTQGSWFAARMLGLTGADVTQTAWFNVSTGAIGSKGANVTSHSMTSVGSGWYRITMTGTTPGVPPNNLFDLYVTNGDNVPTCTNGDNLIVFGCQLEASAFATDYIPTAGGTVTRAIETARFSPLIEAILQRNAGSVVVRADPSGVLSGNPRMIGSDGSVTMVSVNGAGSTQVQTYNGSVALDATLGAGTNLGPVAVAIGFSAAGRSLVGNGGAVATDAAAVGARTTVYLGRSATVAVFAEYGHGYYDEVAISPDRLSDLRLQDLTVPALSSQALWMDGDSYMAGANGVTLATDLKTSTGRYGVTTAVGGATLTNIADRIVDPATLVYYGDYILVIWDGSANAYVSVAAYLAEWARIAAAKPDGKFIFIPPAALPSHSAGFEDEMTAIRDGLLVAYPNNVLDWRTTLFALSDGGGTDTANVAAGVVPTSLVHGDATHLLQPAMTAMAAAVDALIDARGW